MNTETIPGGYISSQNNFYDEVKRKAFASGNIPDGYNGDRADVLFSLVQNTVVTVWEHGFFRAPCPMVIDEREGLWILQNHPSCRHIKNVMPRHTVDKS